MFHGMENEWLGYKSEPIEEVQTVGNIARSWQWRELGTNPQGYPPNKVVLQNTAEDILVQKPLQIRCCDLPGSPRSTFLMVFSPDGTKVASTHGNHNVYVSELASGKHVRILKGHPRTPWCIAFHPSHPQLIGSGCLAGQVRVWDIASGGSETWNVRSETVIASIAFHPREQLLVIATYNELYFWDWSQPAPFNKVSTNNFNEKVRYVAFDSLGYKLITGISLWTTAGITSNSLPNQTLPAAPGTNNPTNRRDDDDDPGNPPENQSGSAQDLIVNSYQNLVQRYDSLVRNYQRLFMVRHRLTNTPPPPNMTDRGTDPMETDLSNAQNSARVIVRPSTSQMDDVEPIPSTSRGTTGSGGDSGDGDSSSSRLLNLDVLSIDSNPTRNHEHQAETNTFGSRSSAFQPLGEGRSFRISDNERSTRLLPNPFSTSSVAPRPSRMFSDNQNSESSNASRTSIFTSLRPEIGLARGFLQSRRNSSPTSRNRSSSTPAENQPTPSTSQGPQASTSGTNTRRPTMTNSSTQMSPTSAPVDAQTINESLDLIRDILRDSGTRLLNLITNVSITTLASVERHVTRRATRTHSEDGEGRPRGLRPRLRLFTPSIRRDLLSSSSDSDSDSLEVNILRTRNSSFREADTDRPTSETSSRPPTDRMEFELNENDNEDNSESSGINVSLSSSRFRVRTQNSSANEESNLPGRDDGAEPSGSNTQTAPESNSSDNSRPSTSRDAFSSRVPSDEAYRKVRSGVAILQKHKMHLTNLWLRGVRITLRDIRNIWESLRRRILTLHRETGRQDMPGYFSRTLLERCMILTEMSDSITRSNRRSHTRNESNERYTGDNQDTPSTSAASTSANAEGEQNNSTETTSENRTRRPLTRSPSIRNPALFRRTLSNYRWRHDNEHRRRSQNSGGNRLEPRGTNRPRRDFARAIEISATRHVVRMRAMQVLSIMFNMIMMCLEERGLSHLIITMLRTLKKALALTCLMLMTNRTVVQTGRSNNPTPSSSQNVDSLNVVRIQNVDDSGPVNVDEPEENLIPNNSSTSQINEGEENSNNNSLQGNIEAVQNDETSPEPQPSTSQATPTTSKPKPTQININSQQWSNRLAVQIAAANRNTSITAINRRDTYLEARREMALHRTNPSAHPMIRKKGQPPVWTYRIPALRSMPVKARVKRQITPRVTPAEEPVAGPSTPRVDPSNDDNNERSEVLNEFEHRVNLIRLAHMQAVRLRNAARNRFRRLQTIRLYTPSLVREMFALQSNNGESSQGPRSPQQGGTETSRRILAQIISSRNEGGRGDEEPSHFHTVLNNVAMPLMQVNDMPVTPEPPSQPQRLPRIHEYLQPIILAQNSMAADDDNGDGGGGPRRMGGMAGLWDPGVISEALPTPSHRVQAWDFTTGKTPDIADSTKNVVVQRCRIHNDASIDISKDGRLLVALLPVPRLRNTNHWLGVYSLEWSRLGQCLHTAVLEQSAVSVALSPTARHLAVGLGSRRFTSTPHARNNVFALLYRLEPLENSSRTGLTPIKELEQHWDHGFTSLNCLRWAPQPGQGLVYANNTGQLVIMS